MDIYESHKKHKRFYTIKRSVSKLIMFLLFAVITSLSFNLFKNNIDFLNANSGAATVLLTAILVIITGYYAIITHKLFSSEKEKRLKAIRPRISYNISKLSIEKYDSQSHEDMEVWNIKGIVKNHNNIAIDFKIEISIPYGHIDYEATYDYLKCSLNNKNTEIAKRESVKIEAEGHAYVIDISEDAKEKSYIKARLSYEDLDANYYIQVIFFEVKKIQNVISVRKVYEEIEFIESKKNKKFYDNYSEPSEEVTRLLFKKHS